MSLLCYVQFRLWFVIVSVKYLVKAAREVTITVKIVENAPTFYLSFAFPLLLLVQCGTLK